MFGRVTFIPTLRECVLVILALIPFLWATTEPGLDSKFSYNYELLTDLSLDSRQGDAADGAEVAVTGLLTLSPVPSIDGWALQLSGVKVAGNGKKTDVQEKSQVLFVQYNKGTGGVEYYQKDSHDSKEDFFSNILRSSADLFQSHSNTLGSCSVLSTEVDGKAVQIKTNCSADKELNKHSNHPLGIVANVQREAAYKVQADKTFEEITSLDIIDYSLAGNKETKSRITSNLKLKLISKEAQSGEEVQMKHLKKLDKNLYQFSRCDDGHCSKIKDFVEFRKAEFERPMLGTDKLALSTIHTILDIQTPSESEVQALLSSKKVKPIRGQMLDVLGALQSFEVYSGVMASLMNKDDSVDDLERYLQTLAVGSSPCKRVMEDILKRLTKDSVKHEKVKETLIMTLSSLAANYANTENFNIDLVDAVDNYLWEHFLKCKEVQCSAQYLRGYLNLRLINRIPDLLLIVQKQNKVLGTIAMKALQSYAYDKLSTRSVKILQSIFHQITRRYDSSIRTLALDILMRGEMNEETVKDLLHALKSNDKANEVKQYLLEQFKLRAGQCDHFKNLLATVMREDPELNNYHRIATGGLTTALTRRFLSYPSFNSSIVSIQEIQKGVLKRGIVDMFFTTEEQQKYSYFTLELYARGLANMMGGGGGADDDKDDKDDEEETLTAGMELIVHGQSLRPLQFFSGQGELMGHVWSGTASDPTPAYQATTIFFEHRFEVALQSGFSVKFDFLTGLSLDLNGQVSLSLWNRNGKSKVQQSIGFATVGRATVITDFSRTVSEFRLLQNPKLNLMSDFEFSANQLLCLQLTQPDITLKKTFWKKNVIPGLKISDEKEKTHSFEITGNSHLLNAKNNEMCRTIHNEL